jgi:hypothetical protein
MFRFLFIVVLGLVGVGLYRGWFSMSSPSQEADNKVNISVSVDEAKVKVDAGKLRARIAQEVAERAKTVDGKTTITITP